MKAIAILSLLSILNGVMCATKSKSKSKSATRTSTRTSTRAPAPTPTTCFVYEDNCKYIYVGGVCSNCEGVTLITTGDETVARSATSGFPLVVEPIPCNRISRLC